MTSVDRAGPYTPAMATALPTRAAWVGILYLAAAFGFGRIGLPAVGYAVVALGAAVLGVWILLRHRPPQLALWLGIAVALAMGVPQLLGLLRGQPVNVGQLAFAIAVGVTAWAATLVPPATVRWSSLGVLGLVSWAGLAAGVAAQLGIFSYGLFEEPDQDRALFGLTQLRGVMPHPNTMGIFAGLAMVLAFRQLVNDYRDGVHDRARSLFLWVGVFLPGLTALVWSQSRTSAVAAFAGLVVSLLPIRRPGWSWLGPTVVALAALTVTLPVLITETTGYGFNGRGVPWFLAQVEFDANPLVGRGTDFLSPAYLAPLDLPWQPLTAHNLLMQAVGESGLVGLLALTLLILIMCLVAIRAVPYDRQWGLIIVVMFFVLGGQESTLSLPVRSGLVLQIAILAASVVLMTDGMARESDPPPATDRTVPAAPPAA